MMWRSIPLVIMFGLGWMALPGHERSSGNSMPSTVKSTATVEGNATVYEFKVTASAGETIKDFHIRPMPDSRFRPHGNPQNSSGTGGPWVASKSSSGFNWRTTGAGLTGGQSVTFKVTAGKKFIDQPVKWVTTSDGDNDPKDGEVDHGPQGGQTPPDPETRGPTASLSIGGEGAPPKIASTYPMAIKTSLNGFSYTVYKMSLEPDDDLTDEDFATFVSNHPVPSSWNLTFVNFQGTLDDDGGGHASIVIPNDPTLVGEDLWLVLECHAAGSTETTRSAPFKVTFTE